MNELFTWGNLNIFPLDSYDVLIGMNWLEAHQVKLDFYNKTFDYIDENGKDNERHPKRNIYEVYFNCVAKEIF
jgi:hypothetical protein